MADVNFIDFAMQPFFIERKSPYIGHYEVRGVQLLPNNEFPYIQTTNVNGGIELEDWTVYVVNSKGIETDVTDYFVIEEIFADDNGYNQFTWSLTDVPFDFGYELVHLKAVQTLGDTFYSNYFMLTDYKSDKTCRIDYKSYNMETMQSIQLTISFKQALMPIEIETYYETSTKNTVINTVKQQSYENWFTSIISNDLLIKIIKLFTYKYTYIDLFRCNLFESIEQKEFTARENFNQNLIKITFNRNDVYNPLTAESPVIVPLVPTITLSSVILNGSLATYSFTLENFTPEYLTYQYSSDQVTWISTNYLVTSPQNIAFNEIGVWYFRIAHPQAVSNVIMIDINAEIDAVNDITQVVKGGTRDISVLFNDVLSGTTLVTAVGSPTNGSASIIEGGTKVRYVHNNSETSSDSFTYTISNGIDTDTATINISIVKSTAFLMTYQGSALTTDVCMYVPFSVAYNFYYKTTGLPPTIGDRIYQDQYLTSAKTATQDRWHKISNYQLLKLDTQGYVIEIGYC